jgi:pimeloyl-ACP methyl ester carboxylesterase
VSILKAHFDDAPLGQLLIERDLIAIDLRGTGGAEPSLACPETQGAFLSDRQVSEGMADAGYKKCRDRLLGGLKHGLAQFGSRQDAQDVVSLASALGLKAWNIYSASFGTRVGLEVLRAKPAGLRSVVLDSAVPHGVALVAESNSVEVLERIVQGCADEADCKAAFGDVSRKLTDALDKLAGTPRSIPLKDGATATLDDAMVVQGIRTMAYSREGARMIPMFIEQVSLGSEGIRDILESARQQDQSLAAGLYLSQVCHEADQSPVAAPEPAGIQARIAKATFAIKALARLCQVWGVSYDPSADMGFPTSDVPTAILSGENDPAVPSAWAGKARAGLSRAQAVTFTGQGHTPGSSACGQVVVAKFFSDPSAAISLPCADSRTPFQFVTQ